MTKDEIKESLALIVEQALALERASIRRELLEAAKVASERIGGWECGDFSYCNLAEHARDVLTIDDLREALDRIVPEEG